MQPNLSGLTMFDCIGYAFVIYETQQKLDKKALNQFLLGTMTRQKSIMLMILLLFSCKPNILSNQLYYLGLIPLKSLS